MLRLECLGIALAGALIVSLSTTLHPALETWEGGRRVDDSLLATLFGESRRLFATHYFVKADAYFHSGYYPTIFDQKEGKENEIHIAEQAGGSAEPEGEEEHDFQGPPRDWIERFGRQFRPNRHTHLGGENAGVDEKHHHAGEAEHADHHGQGHDHDHDKDHGKESGETVGNAQSDHHEGEDNKQMEREILPWLRLSASLDPQRVQTYVVGAYYLKTMGKPDQAEIFLREGFRANPKSYEILMELGKVCAEVRHDNRKARNFWEASLRFWKEQELPKAPDDRNLLSYATVLGNLAKLEESEKNLGRSLEYLNELQQVSPNKESIAKWIQEVKAKQAAPAAP